MSELLKAFTQYVRGLPDPDVHVVMSQRPADEEPSLLPAAPPNQVNGSDLEGRSIDGVAVGGAERGRFAFFMDGMQRPRVTDLYRVIGSNPVWLRSRRDTYARRRPADAQARSQPV